MAGNTPRSPSTRSSEPTHELASEREATGSAARSRRSEGSPRQPLPRHLNHRMGPACRPVRRTRSSSRGTCSSISPPQCISNTRTETSSRSHQHLGTMAAMVPAYPANGEEYGQAVGLVTRLGLITYRVDENGCWSLTSWSTSPGAGTRAYAVATDAALPSVPSPPVGVAAAGIVPGIPSRIL